MPRMAVRPATPADASLIAQLVRDLAAYEREPDAAKGTAETFGEALFGARAWCECLIGEVDGVAQGFALFFHNFSTWECKPGIYLEDLFVRPEARGSGLGKALLQELARLAVARGCARLEWNVLDWNEPALGFYRKLGAVPLSEWTVHRLSGEALRELGR